jgi:hypothetical protein
MRQLEFGRRWHFMVAVAAILGGIVGHKTVHGIEGIAPLVFWKLLDRQSFFRRTRGGWCRTRTSTNTTTRGGGLHNDGSVA